MIVNDEEMTAETMKKDMDWASYGISEVYTAYDTEAARACIAEHSVDILLCDIEMPGENGLGCQDYILIPARYEDIGEKIRKVADRIRGKRDTARYEEYGRQLFQEKIHEGEALESPQRRVQPEETAEEVCRYILKELKNSELNVERIAEEFHFHPAYLNRLFKKEKGVSVGQFLINERMKLAGAILETGQYNANETAEKVGYSHYTNFYNMFKKYYGMSPAKYQEDFLKAKKQS